MAGKTTRPGGLLIVFEGIDGTGKSTQLRLLSEALHRDRLPVVETREPTDGEFGRAIRALYSRRRTISAAEELELFIADRRQHVEHLIAPSLAAGFIVLCDRYYLSTAAYQGAAGFDPDMILARHRFAPPPDLALILELDPAVCIKRITESRGEPLNDFEQLETLKKVDSIFQQMKLPCIRRVDGAQPAEQVHRTILRHVDTLLRR